VGTNFLFAVLTAVYIVIWALAFNASGGFSFPSGAYIFTNGFLSVVLGLGLKVLLGEPGEGNLKSPIGLMSAYCVGMAAMALAVVLASRLRARTGFLAEFDFLPVMKQVAAAFLIIGFALIPLNSSLGSAGSTIAQINKMPVLCVILATYYEVTISKGKRSLNWVNMAGIFANFAYGLFLFSKEGMLVGFAAYAVAAIICGFRFSKLQIVAFVVGMGLFSYYLVPYSQYVRLKRAETFSENVAVAMLYLGDLNETRRLYEDTTDAYQLSEEDHLFDERQGFLDRLIILAPDADLIDFTNKGHIFGVSPTVVSYSNIVPRFIWKNKPMFDVGNVYAHEIGNILADDDTTTGISFSPTADAFHQDSWLGLLLLLPLDFFLYCIICDSVFGSGKDAPWAILPISQALTIGPQGGLGGLVYGFTLSIISVGILALIARYLAIWYTRSAERKQGFSNQASLQSSLIAPGLSAE
jgi:hypothetical protein